MAPIRRQHLQRLLILILLRRRLRRQDERYKERFWVQKIYEQRNFVVVFVGLNKNNSFKEFTSSVLSLSTLWEFPDKRSNSFNELIPKLLMRASPSMLFSFSCDLIGYFTLAELRRRKKSDRFQLYRDNANAAKRKNSYCACPILIFGRKMHFYRKISPSGK